MRDQLRCSQCGDLIGVYEPLVLLADGQPRETSRAAHPDPGEHSECFHRQCYEELARRDLPQR